MEIQITQEKVFDLLKSTLMIHNNQTNTQVLERTRTMPGFCLQLLVIADDKSIQFEIRQAALVTLKTTIDSYYFERDGNPSRITEDDKASLRSSVIQALERNISETKLASTFCEIIYLLALEDYPNKWDVSDHIAGVLTNSQNFSQIYANLLALKSIFSVYNNNTDSYKKGQLVNLIIKTFPPILTLASKLMANYNEVSETILLCILKIFGKATYTQLVHNLRDSPVMHNWYIFLKKILDFKLQNPSQLFIKIKGRALKILHRFVQKHANPKFDQRYSVIFKDKYAKNFLESVVFILMTFNNYKKLFSGCLAALPYFYKNFQNCKGLLEQHKQKLIRLCISKCLISQQDIELWANDPVEFIHKERETRKPLVQFIRSYDNCGFVVGNQVGIAFKSGDENMQQISLYLFAEMRNQILAQVEQEHIITLFIETILPLLISGSSIMKTRACAAVASFIQEIPFPMNSISLVTSKIYECFNSNQLQIKVHAAKALATIIQKYENSIEILEPYFRTLLQGYMVISDQVDSQEIVYSLQKIINKMSQKLEPYAVDLFKALYDLFFKYCERLGYLSDDAQNHNDNDNDVQQNQDEQNAGDSCLGSIRAILLANLSQKFYNTVFDDVYKLVSFIFSENTYNFLQEGLNILNLYLFKINEIHNDFYKFFPLLCYMITTVPKQVLQMNLQNDPVYYKMIRNITQGVDKTIIQNIIGSMRNFIAKTGSSFFSLTDITNTTFINRIFQTVSSIKSQGSYANIGYISILLSTIIQNNIGKIDDIALLIINFVIQEIQAQNLSTKLLTIYLQIVFMCLYYDPIFTINAFDSSKCTSFIFEGIISNPQLFKSEFEKKRAVIAILRLLQIDQNHLAASSVSMYVPEMVKMTVQLALEAHEQRQKGEESGESECQDQTVMAPPSNALKVQMDEESEQDIEEWAEQYNKLYTSPIDSLNEITLLGNFLLNEGQNYAQFMTEESQTKLGEVMSNSNNQRNN